MISTADGILFSQTSAEKYIEDMGVPEPQNRLIKILFMKAGPTYPGSLVFRYGEKHTVAIFQKCNLPYFAGKYHQRITDGKKEPTEELRLSAKEDAEVIWKTAMLSISNYLELEGVTITHNTN